jgi:uncharacterized membrane protein
LTYDLAAWLNLALRWQHVIAGICWIGASFYFVWLDNSLRATDPPTPGVKGELWAVHGGGFYHKRKFTVAPPELPEHLHWFKWEAYTTWITGFLLLSVLYYWGAPVYLIDKAKVAFTPLQAIATGLGFIVGGWLVYEALCRSPLAKFPRLFAALWFLALTGAAFVLTRLFSDRGAFIHVGAIIGTVMAANVLLVIIPGQRKAVAAMIAGTPVDPRFGISAKLRSVQNNYMTLPVIFIMISNHYPIVLNNPLNWLLLSLIPAASAFATTSCVATLAPIRMDTCLSAACWSSSPRLSARRFTPISRRAPRRRSQPSRRLSTPIASLATAPAHPMTDSALRQRA